MAGTPGSRARSASPLLAVPGSRPARRLPRAPARVLRLPLQPHSNMASSVCACPALLFKIIILCVCAANSLNDLSQRSQDASHPPARGTLAPASRWVPRCGPRPPTHSHGHTSRPPRPRPFLLPGDPSVHGVQKVRTNGVSADAAAGARGHTPHTPPAHFCSPGSRAFGRPSAQTCALSAEGRFGAERNAILSATPAPPGAPPAPSPGHLH